MNSPSVNEMPCKTTVAMSNANAKVTAVLIDLKDQTSTPLMSLYAPNAASPLYAMMPRMALISIALYLGQYLLITAYTTNARPSARKDKEARERKERMRARRGVCVFTTTDVI